MAKLEELTNTELADATRSDLSERGYRQFLFIDEMMYSFDRPKVQPHSPIQLTEPNGPIMLTGKPRRG